MAACIRPALRPSWQPLLVVSPSLPDREARGSGPNPLTRTCIEPRNETPQSATCSRRLPFFPSFDSLWLRSRQLWGCARCVLGRPSFRALRETLIGVDLGSLGKARQKKKKKRAPTPAAYASITAGCVADKAFSRGKSYARFVVCCRIRLGP